MLKTKQRTHLYKKDLVSIHDLSKKDILAILNRAHQLKNQPEPDLLTGKVLASCFFEPSTRTRLSFESSMLRLGGSVVGFSDGGNTSEKKGETLHDSMRVMGDYADVLVVRHPLEGAARQAADATSTPVINAGDGANQHPTQTLLDLYSIRECQGKLEDLRVGFVGDLKYGRTVHSLVHALAHFGARMFFVSPPSLDLPTSICEQLKQSGVLFSFHPDIASISDKVDILYMTRIQEERFQNPVDLNQVRRSITLTPELLQGAREHLRVLHPLPRLWEVTPQIDATHNAYYFEQSANGVPVRQALLSMILTSEGEE